MNKFKWVAGWIVFLCVMPPVLFILLDFLWDFRNDMTRPTEPIAGINLQEINSFGSGVCGEYIETISDYYIVRNKDGELYSIRINGSPILEVDSCE